MGGASSQDVTELWDRGTGNVHILNYEMVVSGYVRLNSDQKCQIHEIVLIIIHFYMTQTTELYMVGNGTDGCLGIQKYEKKICKRPTLCALPSCKQSVLQVSTSHSITLILDDEGNVWKCGSEYDKKDETQSIPTKVRINHKAISVSAGDTHCLILLENGHVQSFGENICAQLGHRSTSTPKTIESLLEFRIVQISANGYHSAALTDEGDLFCFGSNWFGQCGVGESENNVLIPTKVALNHKIAFVDCGNTHTLIVAQNGQIHSFGHGGCGKLGHYSDDDKSVPTLIENLKHVQIKTCAAGRRHSLCIDMEGGVWSFGANDYGQCGVSLKHGIEYEPKRIGWFIEHNIKAKDCAAGGNQSSVISEHGDLYLFGSNMKYALGLKKAKKYFKPIKLSIPQSMTVQQISMGDHHTAIICRTIGTF